MDPLSPLSSLIRIDRIQNTSGEHQEQPLPFSRGQILRGRIIGKTDNQFILDIKGRQFSAESQAPLQTGQKLEFLVTSTSPRLSLQILSDPVNTLIGKSLHLLTTGSDLLPDTRRLAAQLPPDVLSRTTRQTLDFFSSLAPVRSGSSTPGQAGEQLLQILSDLLSPNAAGRATDGATGLTSFLTALHNRQGDTLPLLQPILQKLEAGENQNRPLAELLRGPYSPQAEEQLQGLLQSITTLQARRTGNQSATVENNALAAVLLRFFGAGNSSPSRLLLQLLTLGETLLKQENPHPRQMVDGRELQQLIDRIGLNMERLVAEGKTRQAAESLKSALLDMENALAGHSRLSGKAEQLSSTIELYQMLQIRLSGENTLLYPLPLPFLEQGFLLVEPDRKQQGQTAGSRDGKKYSLHLQLEGLGSLRVEILQLEQGIRLRFYAQDATRAGFLSKNREELHSLLTAAAVESVQFLIGSREPARSLLDKITTDGSSVLNTRA